MWAEHGSVHVSPSGVSSLHGDVHESMVDDGYGMAVENMDVSDPPPMKMWPRSCCHRLEVLPRNSSLKTSQV